MRGHLIPALIGATRLLRGILTLSVIAAVAAPAVGVAKGPVLLAPPGNSAISQYAEVVPSDLGATPPRNGGSVGLPQSRGLERLGSAGRVLAAVVRDTAPPPLAPSVGVTRAARAPLRSATVRSGKSVGDAGITDASHPGTLLSTAGAASPGSEVLAAAGGGFGIVLAALTGCAALVGIARAVRRRGAQ